MKESTFITKNEKDWRQLEELLKQPRKDADRLLHLFEKVSGDLAYARTYYPNRSIKVYLNNLTQEVLNSLVKKKEKFQFSTILDFYRKVLPAEIYRSRKAFYTSFIVFVLAVMIGAVSSANVDNFCNIVLGDEYIQMTQDNINEGDPMAVYKKMEQGDMFMQITINNIRVSFFCFVMGLLGSLGTIIILLMNGIMVGAFQFYFYKQGLFLTSFLTIWIHGTIEISSIILAGAAGIILGNGLMFPKSYTRNASLLISAKRALRIILAIMPLFVIAGFLESFVTRLTEMPIFLKVLIISISLLFILIVFVIYPFYCARNGLLDSSLIKVDPVTVESIEVEKYSYQTLGTTLATALASLRMSIGSFLYHMFLPCFLVIAVVSYVVLKFKVMAQLGLPEDLRFSQFESGAWPYGLVVIVLTCFAFIWMMQWSQKKTVTLADFMIGLKSHFLKVLPLAAIYALGTFYVVNDFVWLCFLIIPIHFLFIMLEEIAIGKKISFSIAQDKIKFSFRYWFDFLPITLILICYGFLMFLLMKTPLLGIVTDFIFWHNIFDNKYADVIYVNNLIDFIIYLIPIPLIYHAYTFRYGSIISLVDGVDLKGKLLKFGESKPVYR